MAGGTAPAAGGATTDRESLKLLVISLFRVFVSPQLSRIQKRRGLGGASVLGHVLEISMTQRSSTRTHIRGSAA
jgi:hypothetical protein